MVEKPCLFSQGAAATRVKRWWQTASRAVLVGFLRALLVVVTTPEALESLVEFEQEPGLERVLDHEAIRPEHQHDGRTECSRTVAARQPRSSTPWPRSA
ncbi:MAG: hypothetical protein VKS61_05930 [Candidatus Sericytochromatia bacterium]|nr:hypothetical protein [Candidatus Sericytochromatia bacterium]